MKWIHDNTNQHHATHKTNNGNENGTKRRRGLPTHSKLVEIPRNPRPLDGRRAARIGLSPIATCQEYKNLEKYTQENQIFFLMPKFARAAGHVSLLWLGFEKHTPSIHVPRSMIPNFEKIKGKHIIIGVPTMTHHVSLSTIFFFLVGILSYDFFYFFWVSKFCLLIIM